MHASKQVVNHEGDDDEDYDDDYATVGSVVWIGRPLIITVLVGSCSMSVVLVLLLIWVPPLAP